MKHKIAITLILLIPVVSIFSQKKQEEEQQSNFSGYISYYGKVSRIPDKSKTTARLGNFDSSFKMYLNDDFSKRVESFEGINIATIEGSTQDIYFQSITGAIGDFLIEASPQEQQDYQLTAKYRRYSSVKMKEPSEKRKVCGYTCKKLVCDMVTEDNIRIQLVAWYAPDLYVKNYRIPFFSKLKGVPLIYDTYNGEHVVTYSANEVKKQELKDSFFARPEGLPTISITDYVRSSQ